MQNEKQIFCKITLRHSIHHIFQWFLLFNLKYIFLKNMIYALHSLRFVYTYAKLRILNLTIFIQLEINENEPEPLS